MLYMADIGIANNGFISVGSLFGLLTKYLKDLAVTYTHLSIKVALKPGLNFYTSPSNKTVSKGSIKSISRYGFLFLFNGLPPTPVSPSNLKSK